MQLVTCAVSKSVWRALTGSHGIDRCAMLTSIWQLCTLDRYQYFTMASITGHFRGWHRVTSQLGGFWRFIEPETGERETWVITCEQQKWGTFGAHVHTFSTKFIRHFTSTTKAAPALLHFRSALLDFVLSWMFLRDVDIYSLFNIFFRWVFRHLFHTMPLLVPTGENTGGSTSKCWRPIWKKPRHLMFTPAIGAVSRDEGGMRYLSKKSDSVPNNWKEPFLYI